MDFLIFLIGVALGTVLTLLFSYIKSGYGYFIIEPFDDDEEDTGFYRINVRIPSQEKLMKKKQIILYQENSPK